MGNRPTYRKRTTKKVYKNCQKLQTFITGFKTKKYSQWEHEHILMSWTKLCRHTVDIYACIFTALGTEGKEESHNKGIIN